MAARETSVAWFHGLDSNFDRCRALPGLDGSKTRPHIRSDHVACEHLFRQGHGALLRRNRRQKNFLLQARDIEGKQPSILDYLPGDLVFASSKLAELNFRPRADTLNQREIRRCQQAKVLAVLLVDALDILSDHHLNSGTHLSVGRLLATRAFAASFAADRTDEAAFLHVGTPDGVHASAFQAEIGDFTQCLVEVETIVSGRDLVG